VFVFALDAQWAGVIGTLGGVVATGTIGLATASRSHRWQDESERNTRDYQARQVTAALQRECYARFFAAKEALESYLRTRTPRPGVSVDEALRAMHDDSPVLANDFTTAGSTARIVAGKKVFDALVVYLGEFGELMRAIVGADDPMAAEHDAAESAEAQLLEAMRDEQSEARQPVVSAGKRAAFIRRR